LTGSGSNRSDILKPDPDPAKTTGSGSGKNNRIRPERTHKPDCKMQQHEIEKDAKGGGREN